MRSAWFSCCFLVSALLFACGAKTEAPTAASPSPAATLQSRIAHLKLDFTAPVLIDSSVYVMYPLVLRAGEAGEDEYSGSFSSSRGRAETYWNAVFYNTATGEAHLLSDTQKMVVQAHEPSESGGGAHTLTAAAFAAYQRASGGHQVEKLLYYTVRTTDFNRDGAIDEKDPGYLFVSDRAGRNFRQVSPANYHVNDWQPLEGTNKILLRATAATSNNQLFNENDQAVPFVYDLATNGPARPVFSPGFQTTAKALLSRQWLKRPE